ncbi:DUF2523 family protein [uncultured Endozoicomonas sp.]|uniref:DUF2523 family protein n=1 Tax=uncultured Endozoicomonas sp. TaxID=432652 RepID=UPI0026282EDC|nr:DUF2523 family protein [uncultured Endozoicomonas sp.]
MGYILTFIVTTIVPLAWLLLRGLGVGVVTYFGLDLMVDYLGEQIQANFDGMPVAMFQMISLMGIPNAINIALSFITVIMVVKGISYFNGRPKQSVSFWKGFGGTS